MARHFTQDDLGDPATRRAAWRALMLGDHGVLRLFYDNSHEIDAGKMWRTYQPSPVKLARWKARGIRTVINLRGQTPAGHYALERQACERLGLALIDFRVYSREAPSREIILDAEQLFKQIDYPAMMHCKSGADRAGLMATLYQFFQGGQPFDQALQQLSWRYGHVRAGKTGVIDHALGGYLDYARAHEIDLGDIAAFLQWVAHEYDPAAAKASFMASWWGSLLTEKVLRRE